MSRPLRVVALDVSLAAMGLAATHDADGQPRLHCRTVTPNRTPGAPNRMDHERVHKQFTAVKAACTVPPDVVVVEWLPAFDGKGDTSLRLAELHGVLKQWLWARRIPYVDVFPAHLKQYATGRGGAKKPEVLAAVIARYGRHLHVSSYDEADATALLAMALDAYGEPLERVPAINRKVLTAGTAPAWPTLGKDAS